MVVWLRAKLRAGRDVLAARLRVDENALKKQRTDLLPDLIRLIAEAKAGNPNLEL
jgi:hypothetical protein